MPRVRRSRARSLRTSRLPLGTSLFARDISPTPQPFRIDSNKPARPQVDGSHDSSDSETPLSKPHGDRENSTDFDMSSTHSSDVDRPQSFAAAKLERQNRRIAVANAALSSQAPPAEKNKQSTRGRSKAWKPFDFASDISSISPPKTTQEPAVESRVNVFRVPSQANAMSRPESRISSQTHDSPHISESEGGQDSTSFLESDDFQLFTGRKKGRPSIPNVESKPSVNATVEATFNKRDITEVFGNELPRSGFMDGNPGTVNGQLQFIQHPNGDVSAHQWSASRYGWENIGQFSNIRKKIEGQLAADRLKGETAWQSLQQNTLAYFRTIAKQREAAVMNIPFGAREIAAYLPDKRPPSTAPTGPRRVTSKVEMPERPSTMMPRQEAQPLQIGAESITAAMPSKPTFEAAPRTHTQPSQLNPRFNPALNFTPTPREDSKDDPFTSVKPVHYTHGNMSSPHGQHLPNWTYQQQWGHHMPYDYAYGQSYPMINMSYSGRDYAGHFNSYEQNNMDHLSGQVARMRLNYQHPQSTQQNHQQAPPQNQSPAYFPSNHTSNLSSMDIPAVSPPRRSDNVSETRTAMREHVMKMGEQAKERTKSQANIGRTVMYDPFQDQQRRDSTRSEPVKKEVTPPPASQSDSLGYFPLLGLSKIPGLASLSGNGQEPFPTPLAHSLKIPFNSTCASTHGQLASELRDNSPDREWQRATADNSVNPPTANMVNEFSMKSWDPDRLDEWLWSGNKFARQEDFHQRIMATDATPARRKHSSSASIKHIAPPSRIQPHTSSEDPQSNILSTRLLVPVLENLASYVQGPIEKRHDYFCQWVKAPEWAIDRSASGNDSFFDSEWGQPPARLGRDPRYQPLPRGLDVRFGNFDAPRGAGVPGMDRRFGFGGRF